MFLSSASQMPNMKDVLVNLTSGVSPSLHYHILVLSLVFHAKETEYTLFLCLPDRKRAVYVTTE